MLLKFKIFQSCSKYRKASASFYLSLSIILINLIITKAAKLEIVSINNLTSKTSNLLQSSNKIFENKSINNSSVFKKSYVNTSRSNNNNNIKSGNLLRTTTATLSYNDSSLLMKGFISNSSLNEDSTARNRRQLCKNLTTHKNDGNCIKTTQQ
jgi:hypothetical protein